MTVQDTVRPQALCKAATVNLDASGHGLLTPAQVDDHSTDNCGAGVLTLSLSRSTFTCADQGILSVTLRVEDSAHHMDSCMAQVTVTDQVAPTALCKNATLSLDAGGQAFLAAMQVDNNSSDACGIGQRSVSPSSFTCADIGGNTVQLTVSDGNGNMSICQATVQVVDNTAPVLVCTSISIQLDNDGNAHIQPDQLFQAAASADNCGTVHLVGVSPSQFDCGEVGVNTVTLTANDGNGNHAACQTTVTVNATYPPLTIQATPEACGQQLGSITLGVTGAGGSPIAYSIDGGATWQYSGTFPNITSGVYQALVNAQGLYSCPNPPQDVIVSATGPVQQNIWTGAAGPGDPLDWRNPANWSLLATPTFCHEVVIPIWGEVIISAGFQAVGNTLQLEEGATLTSEATSTLTIGR